MEYTLISESAAIVNLVIATLSLVGGLSIIAGYCATSRQARLRQQLVLGLGVCDFVQSTSIVVGTSFYLNGHVFETNSAGCNGTGFMYQTTVVVGAAWASSIALVTFFTLMKPTSGFTAWLDHQYAVYVIWCVVWALGIIPAIFGTIFFDMSDTGGLCWYRNNTIQSKLMIFVPRALALLTVIALYTALFVFFRRRDLSLLGSTSRSSFEERTDEVTHTNEDRRGSLSKLGQKITHWNRRPSQATHISTLHDGLEYTPPHIDSSRASADVHIEPIPVMIHLTEPERVDHHSENAGSATSVTPPDNRTTQLTHGKMAFGVASDRGEGRPRLPRQRRPLTPAQINKRLSVLMMLYPLAYLILFSVSFGRLIESIVTARPSNPTLRLVSRWLVYGQGFVDGILYFVIEYLFRRSTKGRT